MVFAVLTPLPASANSSSDIMSHPPPTSNRLRLHPSPGGGAAAKAARDSIISSSAKGWSPLQINKRDGAISPLRQSPNPSHLEPPAVEGPRRTSNSFKHVTRNSLVANSPFKNLETTQGKQAAGMEVSAKGKEVIHERRSGEGRRLGEELPTAEGSAATPKAAIGLGISATAKPRSASRTASSSKSAAGGTRRVSNEKKAAPSDARRVSGERRVSTEKKENESPNLHTSQRLPRQSTGVKGLRDGNHVSRSPFVVGKRIPSGEIRLDSPVPSPRSSSRQNLSVSPSPRRVSGQRRVSPAHHRSRGAGSTTPSPPRHFSHSNSLSNASPLGKRGSPGPKSALTPSRRLLGPRHALGMADSPSKQSKTVTFQSVPDVKEFEQMSVDGSADGSFEIELDSGSEYDRDWVDEGAEGDSLEEILPNDRGVVAQMGQLRVNNDAAHHESTTADFVNTLIEEGLFSPQQTPALGDQQTPAFEDQPTFASSADEDSAPYLSTPSLGEDVHMSPMFAESALPESNYPEKDSAGAPYGRTHHAERAALAHSLPPLMPTSPFAGPHLPMTSDRNMLLNANAAQPSLPTKELPTPGTKHLSHQVEPFHDPFITIQTATRVLAPQAAQREEAGVPLGRTSHADRVNAARSLATQSLGLGMPRSPGRIASDATEVDSESGSEVDSGSEDDERSFNPTPRKRSMTSTTVTTTETTTVVVQEEREDGARWREEETPRRGLPKPPKVQEVKVPSPIQSPVKPAEEDKVEKRSSRLDFSGFALPLINMSSPFFRTTPTLDSQLRIPSNDASTSGQSTEDDDRPITPPPSIPSHAPLASPTANEDSSGNITAHRIPSFEFEEIKLTTEEMLIRRATVLRNPHSPTKPTSASTSTSSGFTNPFSSQDGLSRTASTTAPAEGSVRVRQRISREMIRETIDRKYAEGSISRRPHSALGIGGASTSYSSMNSGGFPSSSSFGTGSGFSAEQKRASTPGGGYSTSVAPPTLSASSSDASARNKDLPPPPISTPMLKSSTEVPRSNVTHPPLVRPRSYIQSPAGEVIRQSSEMGNEPSSGLDRIIAGGHSAGTQPAGLPQRSSTYGPTATIARPVSILQNPHPYIPPAQSTQPRTPSRSETAPVPAPVVFASSSNSSDFGVGRSASRGRDVSGLSAINEGSRSSRKSRRSMSMSDANEEMRPSSSKKQPRLTLGLGHEQESMSEAFADEMESISGDRNYKVREKHVLGASFGNTVSHSKAGDIDGGKAWRQLRRPSDINEHAAEIRAMRTREVSHGKVSGTIFVKVLGIESLVVPVPAQPTFFCMTLDNGIDYIRTPYTPFQDGARVNQEFALVEHPNFEFSLSMDIRRDPHIIRALQDLNTHTVQSRVPSLTQPKPSSTGSGIRNLFSSPRKNKTPSAPPSRPITPQAAPNSQPMGDTIARYLALPSSSTIAKTHVAFKPIAKQCEAKVLEIRYPMFAMFKGEPDRPREGGKGTVPPNTPRRQVAKVTLQVFRLPPLPGIKPEDLPQCIDECLRGMRHHAWHECEYHEGNLTQEGGDCSIPRRRMFKLIGGNMVAYNEITRKEVTTIDLRQATSVIDLNPDQSQRDLRLAAGRKTPGGGGDDDDEGMGMFGARPRSFRVEFKGGEGIVFSADKESDKATWMETLNGLIGKIPSNPLWAELLASMTKDKHDRSAAARSVSRSTTHTATTSGSAGVPSRAGSTVPGQERRRETSQAMGKTRSAPAQVQKQLGVEGGRTMTGRKAEGVV